MTLDEYENEASWLKTRFKLARTIVGRHRFHSFVPLSTELLEVHNFSSSEDKRIQRVALSNTPVIKFTAINGHIAMLPQSKMVCGGGVSC